MWALPMLIRGLFLLWLGLLLVATGWRAGDRAPASAEGTTVLVKPGPYDQVRLRVESAPKHQADSALFEAQGFDAASSRFIQMDITRRVGTARLAEVFGEAGFERDRMVLAGGVPLAALKSEERLRQQAPEAYRLLQSYADGVNRFLTDIDNSAPSVLRFYRQQTRDPSYRPSPWTPGDSLAVAGALEFYMSTSLQQKLILGALFYRVLDSDPKKLEKFLDFRPIENEFVIEPQRRPASIKRGVRSASLTPVEMDYEYRPLGFPFPDNMPPASNAWAINREFSGGKQAFLANDPHLPIFLPSTFREISLDSTPAGGTFRLAGMSVPGLPGIFIGHNDHIGWGLTNLLADVDDVYIERLTSGEDKVRFRGGEVKLRVEKRSVLVRAASGKLERRTVKLRWVPHHGPILSDHIPGLILPHGMALSYRWAGHEGSLGVQAIFDLNRAKDFETFKSALAKWESGGENVLYADTKGNIGYFACGRIPVRPDPGRVVGPFLPVPGQGDYEWQGYRTEAPQLYNPASGRIISSNNDIYGKNAEPWLSSYDDYISFKFTEGARARRIRQMLDASRGRIERETLRRIQFDHRDLVAIRMQEIWRATLDGGPQKRATASLSSKAKALEKRLLKWDAEMSRDSVEAALFNDWFTLLLEDFFSDLKKPGLLPGFMNSQLAIQSLYHRLREQLSTDPALVRAHIDRALEKLAEKAGRLPTETTTWGEIHPLGITAPLINVLSVPVDIIVPRDGSWFTVDVGAYVAGSKDGIDAHRVPSFYGANFRMILELEPGKPIRGYAVSPAAAGGRVDPFTSVQEIEMWQKGELRPLIDY